MQSKVPAVPKQMLFHALTGLFPGRKSDQQQDSWTQAPPLAEALQQQQYLAEHIDDFCDCV